jgi:uncharacterized protein YgiB involved in biofilm formation
LAHRRRRSVLLVSSLLAAGAAGCERQAAAPPAEENLRVYASAEECAAEWNAGDCEAGLQQAKEEHLKTAPTFADRAQCEQQYQCEEHRQGGSSVFVPILAGYMMGRMMGASYVGRPLYMDRRGASFSGLNRVGEPFERRGSGAAGAAGMPPRTVNARLDDDGRVIRSSSTTRGGFGQTSSYRGSAGG